MKYNISLALLCVLISGCTKSGSDSSALSSVVGDITGSTPEATNAAQKQVKEIQASLNQDPNYQLTDEDQNLLVSESLVADQTEIKAWVK